MSDARANDDMETLLHEPWLALPGLMRRIRRLADLSQRDLARELGVGKSVVARWEIGQTCPSTDQLHAAAGLAGLRIALVDADGDEVAPMSYAAEPDRAGRYQPAHLDVEPLDWFVPRRPGIHLETAYDVEYRRSKGAGDPQARYRRRRGRDLMRRFRPVPDDHPTLAEMVDELRERDRRRAEANVEWDKRRRAAARRRWDETRRERGGGQV